MLTNNRKKKKDTSLFSYLQQLIYYLLDFGVIFTFFPDRIILCRFYLSRENIVIMKV